MVLRSATGYRRATSEKPPTHDCIYYVISKKKIDLLYLFFQSMYVE